MIRALAPLLVLAIIAVTGSCKKKPPSYDQSTPEAAVASFFGAINEGRIPGDLARLISTSFVIQEWQLRCRKGCKQGSYQILGREDKGPNKVVLRASFTVRFGDGDSLHVTNQPILLDKLGQSWLIGDFGERHRRRIGRPKETRK